MSVIRKGAKVIITRGTYLGRQGEVVGYLEKNRENPIHCVWIGACDVVPCTTKEIEELK